MMLGRLPWKADGRPGGRPEYGTGGVGGNALDEKTAERSQRDRLRLISWSRLRFFPLVGLQFVYQFFICPLVSGQLA
jgi:hypothetical protein